MWSVVLVPLAVLAVPLGLAHLEAWILADGRGPGTPPVRVAATGPGLAPGSAVGD